MVVLVVVWLSVLFSDGRGRGSLLKHTRPTRTYRGVCFERNFGAFEPHPWPPAEAESAAAAHLNRLQVWDEKERGKGGALAIYILKMLPGKLCNNF